jgi:hypothetical protein
VEANHNPPVQHAAERARELFTDIGGFVIIPVVIGDRLSPAREAMTLASLKCAAHVSRAAPR